MKTSNRMQIKFPCDCISSTTACDEPWAEVAKKGMFKGGTKEKILNSLARRPRTIAQLARVTRLSRPTVLRHVFDLVRHRLIKEATPESKEYVFERYYTPNFPVVPRDDQALLEEEISALAEAIAAAFRKRMPSLTRGFAGSRIAGEGWLFAEAAQYLLHAAQRRARAVLEAEGLLAKTFASRGLNFAFWGTEELRGGLNNGTV